MLWKSKTDALLTFSLNGKQYTVGAYGIVNIPDNFTAIVRKRGLLLEKYELPSHLMSLPSNYIESSLDKLECCDLVVVGGVPKLKPKPGFHTDETPDVIEELFKAPSIQTIPKHSGPGLNSDHVGPWIHPDDCCDVTTEEDGSLSYKPKPGFHLEYQHGNGRPGYDLYGHALLESGESRLPKPGHHFEYQKREWVEVENDPSFVEKPQPDEPKPAPKSPPVILDPAPKLTEQKVKKLPPSKRAKK